MWGKLGKHLFNSGLFRQQKFTEITRVTDKKTGTQRQNYNLIPLMLGNTLTQRWKAVLLVFQPEETAAVECAHACVWREEGDGNALTTAFTVPVL